MNQHREELGEGVILGRYLIGQSPPAAAVELYERIIGAQDDATHEKALAAALRRPGLLPYLDAQNALFRPNSQLRQRLYLLFSILEATPDITPKFLPAKHSGGYLVVAGLLGARSVYRLLVGSVIVKVQGL